jgi:hypothetical protein
LEQGRHEEAIIKQCLRDNKPFPKKIQDAPELQLGLFMYWGAFWDLDTCRPVADGVFHPIPWYAIDHWATVNELSEDQRECLHFIIRAMDNEFITKKQNMAKTQQGPKPLLKRFR